MSRRTIVITADDFGRSAENNAGVMAAHRAGVLTTASLMVGEPGFPEALALARGDGSLAVGLHVCLSDGVPVSRPSDIPRLVGSDGRFPDNEQMLHRAVYSRAGRRQIRAEIAAQFETFAATGLVCDHVDVHRNSHMHPLVAIEIFRAAAARNIQFVRVPYDPVIERPRRAADPLRFGRTSVLRWLAAFYGLRFADRVIGRDWKDPARLAALIAVLPGGTSELFFHPVICEGDHMFRADLPVMLDGQVALALHNSRM